MRWARLLVLLSAGVLAITGVGYVVVPGSMLAIVGVESTSTTDFLLRTEGVALLAGAGFLWAIRDGRSEQFKVVLVALSAYYILSSAVDAAAFMDGVVGPASVPSAVVRVAVGVICIVQAARLSME